MKKCKNHSKLGLLMLVELDIVEIGFLSFIIYVIF